MNTKSKIIRYLEANIAHPQDAEILADKIMATDNFDEQNIKGEIPGSYTLSGNPIPFVL